MLFFSLDSFGVSGLVLEILAVQISALSSNIMGVNATLKWHHDFWTKGITDEFLGL